MTGVDERHAEEARVTEALTALGSTSDAVAKSLIDLKIKGTKYTSKSCPLAVYLTSKGFRTPKVGASYVTVATPGQPPWNDAEAELPEPCAQFVEAFDEGCWPELEREEVA